MDKKRMKTIAELQKSISDTETTAPAAEPEDTASESAKSNGKAAKKSAEKPAEQASGEGVSGEIEEMLAKAEQRANESMDKYVRTLAEFDNFRKRTTKEKAVMYSDGAADVIKSLLPVIDSFERALGSCGDEEKSSSIYKGIELIHRQLTQFMEENGITEIEAVGCEFDPELHAAVAHMDDPEYGENEIVEELQKGYMLKDKVIRHSMVKVAN